MKTKKWKIQAGETNPFDFNRVVKEARSAGIEHGCCTVEFPHRWLFWCSHTLCSKFLVEQQAVIKKMLPHNRVLFSEFRGIHGRFHTYTKKVENPEIEFWCAATRMEDIAKGIEEILENYVEDWKRRQTRTEIKVVGYLIN
jgi:hypothetical protein